MAVDQPTAGGAASLEIKTGTASTKVARVHRHEKLRSYQGIMSRLADLREEDRGALSHMVDALRANNRFKSLAADLG